MIESFLTGLIAILLTLPTCFIVSILLLINFLIFLLSLKKTISQYSLGGTLS